MGFLEEREKRIGLLIALSVKNSLTPDSVAFCDFILKASAAKFAVTRQTAKGYVDTLLSCWRWGRWKEQIKTNNNLTQEEKDRWIKEH